MRIKDLLAIKEKRDSLKNCPICQSPYQAKSWEGVTVIIDNVEQCLFRFYEGFTNFRCHKLINNRLIHIDYEGGKFAIERVNDIKFDNSLDIKQLEKLCLL